MKNKSICSNHDELPFKRQRLSEPQEEEVLSKIHPTYSRPNVWIDDTVRFSIEPIKRFERRCVDYQKPNEVACFSFDRKHNFSMGDSEMKYYYPPNLCNCQLSDGYDMFESRDCDTPDPIDAMLECLMRSGFSGDLSIVTWRGILTKILCTPYSKNDSWELGAELYNDCIFLDERITPEKISQNNAQTTRQKLMSYWGYKFETLSTITAPQPPSSLPPDKLTQLCEDRKSAVVNNNVQFCSVVKTRLGGLGVVVGAEVDGAEELPCSSLPKSEGYIELKTNKLLKTNRDEWNLERYKFLRIWAQSYLAGIPKVIIGFRDDDGKVHYVKEYKTVEIPRLVRGKRNMWDPTVCLNFAYDFIKFLKKVISAPSHPSCSTVVKRSIEDGAHNSSNCTKNYYVYTISFKFPGDAIIVLRKLNPLYHEAVEEDNTHSPLGKKEPGRGVLPAWFVCGKLPGHAE